MNNIIEEVQEGGKGQDEIEFEDRTNENFIHTELDVSSEQSEDSSSEEYQIERNDIGDEEIVSDNDAAAKSPTGSPSSVSTQTKPECSTFKRLKVLCYSHYRRSGACSRKPTAD
jgi:hypothetical protein